MLQLPPTIRTAGLHEVPKQGDILDRIAESKIANIVEGFIFRNNETQLVEVFRKSRRSLQLRRLYIKVCNFSSALKQYTKKFKTSAYHKRSCKLRLAFASSICISLSVGVPPTEISVNKKGRFKQKI
ncbi:hypothetical protein [Parafilimonas terrae]|jgi:hypothetical protein|nr:hypothetical protein [Parafilimonas terrae]